MADRDQPAGASQHPPTQGSSAGAETREETIARVAGEDATPEPVPDSSITEDPSDRRGLTRILALRWITIGALAGAAVGAVVAVFAWFLFDDDVLGGDGGRIGVTIGIVLGAAIIGGVFSGLWNLAREDGRIQREIEEDHPSASEGPGDGSDPRLDPPEKR